MYSATAPIQDQSRPHSEPTAGGLNGGVARGLECAAAVGCSSPELKAPAKQGCSHPGQDFSRESRLGSGIATCASLGLIIFPAASGPEGRIASKIVGRRTESGIGYQNHGSYASFPWIGGARLTLSASP